MKKCVKVTTLVAAAALIPSLFSCDATAATPAATESCRICHKEAHPLGNRVKRVPVSKKLKPGEIGIAEFREIVQKIPDNIIILDVREGTPEGRLPGAISIPHSELEARATEVPKDKEIIIHCKTGVLAKMACHDLKNKGHKNIRYLNAAIQVAKDGSYEITVK